MRRHCGARHSRANRVCEIGITRRAFELAFAKIDPRHEVAFAVAVVAVRGVETAAEVNARVGHCTRAALRKCARNDDERHAKSESLPLQSHFAAQPVYPITRSLFRREYALSRDSAASRCFPR